MRTFVQKPRAIRQSTSDRSALPRKTHYGQGREVNSILHLQRAIGNQALQRLIQNQAQGPEASLVSRASTERRTPGLKGAGEFQAYDPSKESYAGFSQMPAYASAHGSIQSQWAAQNSDQQSTTTPPTLAPDQIIDPPVSLNGQPSVSVRPRLDAANTDHSVHLTVAEMEARALWNVDSTRHDVGDWAVGFYQALIPLDMHHCYEPLSRGPGPGSFPVSGPHWVTRRQPTQTYEFDFLHQTPIASATSGQPLEARTRDMPGVRRANVFVHPGSDQRWTRIREPAYVADFYLQAVAINTTINFFLPLWNARWVVETLVGHRHPGAPSPIDSIELSPFRAEVVSSEAQSMRGGHRGLVSGIPRSSSQNVGSWVPGCQTAT